MAVKGIVVGFDPATKESETPHVKTLDVEVDGRDVIVTVGKQHVALDWHTVGAAVQLLQAAFMEVS